MVTTTPAWTASHYNCKQIAFIHIEASFNNLTIYNVSQAYYDNLNRWIANVMFYNAGGIKKNHNTDKQQHKANMMDDGSDKLRWWMFVSECVWQGLPVRPGPYRE